MTPFQKKAIVALNKLPETIKKEDGICKNENAIKENEIISDFADKLFRSLEINNVDFKPLVIPIAELDLERFIPLSGEISAITNLGRINELMHLAVVFDLYIPSKRWVANLKTGYGKKDFLEQDIETSIRKAVDFFFEEDALLKDILLFTDRPHTIKGVLTAAVKSYLSENDITHPLDSVPSFRQNGYPTNGLLLANDKIDEFVYKIIH